MRRERRPPWWLMYATVAMLSVRIITRLSCSSDLKWRRASHTTSNSRQLICHCRRGPVQSPAAACPLHMASQPMAEASVDTTTCLDTCTRGTRQDGGDRDPVRAALPCPSRDPVVKPMLKRSHMKQSERRDSGCGCRMPLEPLKLFQWTRPLVLERLQAVQHRLSTLY